MVLCKDMKFAICFGLIMGAILSICNMCFAVEREQVTFSTIDNVAINPNTQKLISYNNSILYYVALQPGYKYFVINNASLSKNIAFMNSLEVGSDISVTVLVGGSSISFDGSVQYLYVGDSATGSNSISIEREKLEGLPNFVDNIAYSLSIGDLSQVWVLVVPIIAISVLLGLGFYLLKRLLNRIKRAKDGV